MGAIRHRRATKQAQTPTDVRQTQITQPAYLEAKTRSLRGWQTIISVENSHKQPVRMPIFSRCHWSAIPSRRYRTLLDFKLFLSVLLTVRSYMRGIKITINILTKKLVVASSLLGSNGGTN
jgi:hypothetical protein